MLWTKCAYLAGVHGGGVGGGKFLSSGNPLFGEDADTPQLSDANEYVVVCFFKVGGSTPGNFLTPVIVVANTLVGRKMARHLCTFTPLLCTFTPLLCLTVIISKSSAYYLVS
jgi:hypothetical protein